MSDMNETGAVCADGTEGSASAQSAVEQKDTYTADEVRTMLQSEADRRVSGAKKRWEKELADRIEVRSRELAEKLTSDYAERIAALEGELAQTLERSRCRERSLEIAAALERASLPGELLPMVEAAEEGREQELIDALRRTVDERSLEECARRLGTRGPAAGGGRTLTTEEIRSLPVARLAELMRG